VYGWNRPTFFIDPTGHEVRDLRGYTIDGFGVVTARDDTTVYANPTNDQLIEQYERGQITYDEAVIGQIRNQTRALASTTQDYEKSWTRNLVEETVSNIAWDVTSPAHDTLEGLATQDPALIGYGLGKTAAVGALGVVVKEGAPVVVEKLVEKVPVLGKDVRQLAGEALGRAKAVFEGATEQAKRLLQAEIEFSPGTIGANLGNVKIKIPPKTRRGGIGPVRKGQAGEALSEAEAVAAGETVLGRQVTFELPSGRRTRPDLLTEKPSRGLKAREAKHGPTAKLTARQQELQETIQRGGAVVPRGAKAEQSGLTPGKAIKLREFEEDRY
jgi:hypothetical protein